MTGMAGHDPGISGHVRPESLVTLLRNTQYDNVSLLLLSNHNIWVTLDAIQRANEIAFGNNREEKTPKLYIDCIDLIDEAFTASDWRSFIENNKNTFNAHSRSIYDK
jgi:hypothetical protein